MTAARLAVHPLGRGIAAALRGSAPGVTAAALMFLAVPQLYFLPKGTSDVAVSTIILVVLAPGVLVALWCNPGLGIMRTPLLWGLILLAAIRLLALARSPEPSEGFQPVVLLGEFVILLMLMTAALRRDRSLLRRLEPVYWPWIGAEAALVIVFRLFPGIEDAFLHSLGPYVAGHNTVGALFGDGPNNVLDSAKSGGVFVNANVAALFLGVNSVAALASSLLTKTKWVRAIGVAAMIVVPFTGSKYASILAVLLICGNALYLIYGAVPTASRRYLFVVLCLAAAGAVLLLATVGRRFLHALADSFSDRTLIWGFGRDSFLDKPFLGLGYGGWNAEFPQYAADHGLYRSFPPHNMFLAAWSNTGLPGLCLSVLFFVTVFWLVFRRLANSSGVLRRFTALTGIAVAWVLIHGLADNTDIFGEIHLLPVLSLLLACLIAPAAEEMESVQSAHGEYPATPALPTVGDLHHPPGIRTEDVPAVVCGEGSGPSVAERPIG